MTLAYLAAARLQLQQHRLEASSTLPSSRCSQLGISALMLNHFPDCRSRRVCMCVRRCIANYSVNVCSPYQSLSHEGHAVDDGIVGGNDRVRSLELMKRCFLPVDFVNSLRTRVRINHLIFKKHVTSVADRSEKFDFQRKILLQGIFLPTFLPTCSIKPVT